MFSDARMNEAKQIALDTFVDGGLKRLNTMRIGWQKESQSPKPKEREEAVSALAATDALSHRKEEPQPYRPFAGRWLALLTGGFRLKPDELLCALQFAAGLNPPITL